MQAERNNRNATLTPDCQEVGNLRYSVRRAGFDDPVERAVWYEVRHGDWVAAYRVLAHEGRPIIGEIRLFPFEEGSRAGEWSGNPESAKGGVRSEVARQLATERTLEAVRSIFEAQIDSGNGWPLPRFDFDPGPATDVILRPHRTPLRELARDVAKPCADAKRRGDPTGLAVASHYGCKLSYAPKLKRKARDADLLTEDLELTDKTRKLLAARDG